jgi:hypothetical protein
MRSTMSHVLSHGNHTISECVPLPVGYYYYPRREQEFVVCAGKEFVVCAHYDAEAWIGAMNFHPLKALLHGLLPEHGYVVDDGAGHRQIFANSPGLRHIREV